MDNDMIVQYINGVEPDFSYGTSDGMSRAMVESVENMAMINDYITESTYEVITEAKEDKPGFWGKLGNKISYYFALFMKLVNKFITKIKGFFMMVKRKLTVAFAKAIKAVAGFLRNRINNNRKKFDTVEKDDEVEIYKWNDAGITRIHEVCSGERIVDSIVKKLNDGLKSSIIIIPASAQPSYTRNTTDDAKKTAKNINNNITSTHRFDAYNDIVEVFNDVKETINEVVSAETEDTNKGVVPLLVKQTVEFSPNQSKSFLKDEFTKNVSKQVDTTYNTVMKGCKEEIKVLNELEKLAKKGFKKSLNKDNETFSAAKSYYKAINYAINQLHLLKYRASGKMASACFKYYKKLFSGVRKVFGGINIFGKSGDVEEKNESADLLYTLQ